MFLSALFLFFIFFYFLSHTDELPDHQRLMSDVHIQVTKYSNEKELLTLITHNRINDFVLD